MVGTIILATLALLTAAFFVARAYDAHRVRRLARMERYFQNFADISQLLLRGRMLNDTHVKMIAYMLGAFSGESRGWETIKGLRAPRLPSDPALTAELRAMPDMVLDGLALTIESYYRYVAEVQPLAGFFIDRRLDAIKAVAPIDKKQGEAKAISMFQRAFDRRHPTPA